MTDSNLLNQLREIQSQLKSIKDGMSAGQPIDDEAVSLLSGLAQELMQIAENAQGLPPASADKSGGAGLRQRLLELETEHPQVTSLLSQLTELMGMMGI